MLCQTTGARWMEGGSDKDGDRRKGRPLVVLHSFKKKVCPLSTAVYHRSHLFSLSVFSLSLYLSAFQRFIRSRLCGACKWLICQACLYKLSSRTEKLEQTTDQRCGHHFIGWRVSFSSPFPNEDFKKLVTGKKVAEDASKQNKNKPSIGLWVVAAFRWTDEHLKLGFPTKRQEWKIGS